MKRITKIVLYLLGVVMLSACSVNMDLDFDPMDSPQNPSDDGSGDFVTSFGTLVLQPTTIVTDEGKILSVVEMAPSIGWRELESVVDGSGRAVFNYTILSSLALNRFSVRLNSVYEIFIDELEFYDSTTTENGAMSKLIHPAMPYQATYSGGYVNMNIYYNATLSPEERRPNISLNCDMATSTEDTLMAHLCYVNEDWESNPYGPLRNVWFSFRVPEEYVERVSMASIFAFQWCWWLDDNNYEEGIGKTNVSIMYADSFTDGGRLAILPQGL